MIYEIKDSLSLREVYLSWLITANPKQFASENGLAPEQLMRFRTVDNITWKDFKEAREELLK